MSQVTLFISAVSSEFAEDPRHPERARGPGDYRAYLRDKLTGPDVSVKVQEDFVAAGVLTLDKLALYIESCDAVIHLVGDMTGAAASPPALQSLYATQPGLGRTLPFAGSADDAQALGLSYTQWEAYLALHFAKRLVVCTAAPQAPRAAGHVADDDQRRRQAEHLERLVTLKHHAEVTFASREELAVEVLRMLRTVLPAAKRESLPAPPCRLPYPPLGELFIGRDTFLTEIRARLERAQREGAWPRQVVHGLGGLGKTRLAVEYAWRYRDRYAAVLMISGESGQTLDHDLASLTGVLRIPCDPDAPEPQRTRLALDWLREHPGWLLVIDNVDTEQARDAVAARLPEWTAGHVLITARVADWPREVETLDLHVLSPDDAARFLLDATAGRRTQHPDDAQIAHALANDELGALCLALEQAAAYITKLQIPLAEYRRRWATNAKDVRRRADKALMRYHEEKDVSLSVATTWQTTVDQLRPGARTLLEMVCWLASDPLPMGLFEHDAMTAAFDALGAADDDLEESLAELRSYSLLSRRESGPLELAGRVHRLVQLVTRDSLATERRERTLRATIAAVTAYADPAEESQASLARLDALDPHILSLIAHADAARISDGVPGLLRARGSLLGDRARYADSIAVFQRAITIDEAAGGPDHADVAADLSGMASSLAEMGRFGEAESRHRRALAIDETRFGPDHPRVAKDLESIGVLLQAEGRYADAEPLIQRALAIYESRLGPDHPSVADALSALARGHAHARNPAEAERLLRRALAIDERHYGSDDIGIVTTSGNLAHVLQEQGALEEAEMLCRRAAAISERVAGPDHPYHAMQLSSLAQVLSSSRRYDEAETVLRRAIAIDERALGPENRMLAPFCNQLGLLLREIGRLEDAETAMRRSIAIAERIEDGDQAETATSLGNLALILRDAGRAADAEPAIRSALAIDERLSLTPSHATARDLATLGDLLWTMRRVDEADTVLCRAIAAREAVDGVDAEPLAQVLTTLAQVRCASGRPDDAHPLLERAIAIDERRYGPDHPLVAAGLFALAQVLDQCGRGADGEPFLRRALSTYESYFGPEHVQVAAVLGQLGRLVRDSGRLEEADALVSRALAIEERAYAPTDLRLAFTLARLALVHHLAGRGEDARVAIDRAVALYEAAADPQPAPEWLADVKTRVYAPDPRSDACAPR